MALHRTGAAVATAVLLLSACSAADDIVDGVTDLASEIADGGDSSSGGGGTDGSSSADGSAGGDGGASADGQAASDAAGSTTDAGTDDGSGTRAEADDAGPVGANGKPMLQSSYATMVLEIDVQSCTSVDQGAVDHLVATLRSVVDKPGGIVLEGGNTFDSDRTQWTSADLRANAAANRSTSSSGDRVSVYLQYVCGAFHAGGQQTTAIGVAYNASEVGIFPQRWNDGIGVLLGSNRAVERAVLVHELGHLFGLVNITYASEIDHEDADHPGHSNSKSSAMYWAIESTAIGQAFTGPPPDTFDDADRADLEGLKSGRY